MLLKIFNFVSSIASGNSELIGVENNSEFDYNTKQNQNNEV